MDLNEDLLLATMDRVGHAYALIHDLTKRSLEGSGMGVGEAVALSVLHSVGKPLSQSEWARLNAFSRQRAHVIAHRLLDRGLVALSRQGRTSTVALTERGRRQIRSKHQQMARAFGGYVKEIPPREIERLHQVLGTLIAALEHVDPETDSAP